MLDWFSSAFNLSKQIQVWVWELDGSVLVFLMRVLVICLRRRTLFPSVSSTLLILFHLMLLAISKSAILLFSNTFYFNLFDLTIVYFSHYVIISHHLKSSQRIR